MNRTFRFLSIIAALVALPACTTTSASVTTEYYSVRGDTSRQLDRELKRKGPMKGHALATAAIRFVPVSTLQETGPRGCRFKTATFKVEANLTLPKWENRAASKDKQLRRAWDNLARYAKLHEETHVRIAERFAQIMGKEIRAIAPQKDCEALDRLAAKTVKSVTSRHNRAQLLFDNLEQKRLAAIFAAAEENS